MPARYLSIPLPAGVLLCTLASLACHRASRASTSGDTASESAGESEETSEETSDDSGTTGGTPGPTEPPWGDPIDPCEGVTCSGHGTCIATGVLARCRCEDGFLARRHECLTCTPLGEDHVYDIDVPMITVQPEVTVAGAASLLDTDGSIYLISGSDILLVTHLPDAASATTLIPGVYDLRFDGETHPNSENSLPRQRDIKFATNLTIDASGSVPIDLPVATVTATLRVDGEVPDGWLNTTWGATFVDPASGDSIDLADIDEFTGTVDVIPGVYDLFYRGWGIGVPANGGTVLAKNAVIAQSGHAVLDVDTIYQFGTTTVGGEVLDPLPFGEQNVSSVALFNPLLGVVSLTDPAFESEYGVRLIPGTYDVIYGVREPSAGLPDNEHAILPAGLVIATDGGTTNIDIPIVTRSGALTVNGIPVAANEWGSELYYINRTSRDRVFIRDLAWGQYSVEMIPGVYDLLYEQYEPRPALPANRQALIATGIVVDAFGSFDIDVPMITVSGSLTLNGQVAGLPEDAQIEFWQSNVGERVVAGDISVGTYSINLIPGTYDVRYRAAPGAGTPPVGLPANYLATVLRQVVLTESGNLDIDVPAVEVTGSLTINGEPVPGGSIKLLEVGVGSARLGGSAEPFSTLVVSGTYAVTYSVDGPSEPLTVPSNQEAILDCIVIE